MTSPPGGGPQPGAQNLLDVVPAGTLDYVTCIFALSALPTRKAAGAVKTLFELLKPGGYRV